MTTTTPVRCAVIGHPVAHSLSPQIHAAFAKACGLELIYERVQAPLDGFAAVVRRLQLEGWRGCNVTLPFKGEAFALAQHSSARARLALAANTLSFALDTQEISADNTDGVGLCRDLRRQGVALVTTHTILLLGAGGAAAGVLGELLAARPRQVLIANRSLSKAVELAARHAASAAAYGVDLHAIALDAVQAHGAPQQGAVAAVDLIINATSASLKGDSLTLHERLWQQQPFCYDMMYGATPTAFLQQAHALGCRGADGLGMLVEQAAQSFHIWHGVMPATDAVLATLRAGLATQH